MDTPLTQLAAFHRIIAQRLRSASDLSRAASLSRSLVHSDIDGAGAFLLFALYFEELVRLREGTAVDVEKYESGVSRLASLIEECLEAIENYDPVRLHASLDSFARTALRLQLP